MLYDSAPMQSLRARVRGSVGGLSPVFWVLFWGMIVNRSASFVLTFMSLHFKQDLGLSHAQAGHVVALWGLGSTLASLVAGVLADGLGRRATMLLGLVFGALSVVALAFVATPGWVAVITFAGGATQALYYPASNAAIADIVPFEDRQRAYGHMYWAANMGLASGYFVAGFVHSRSIAPFFLADAGTTLLCAALVAFCVPETHPTMPGDRSQNMGDLTAFVRDGPFVTLVLLHFAALVVFTQFQLALPLDMAAHGCGPQRFSWLMAFNCMGVVVLQPWLTPLLRRFDASRLLSASVALFGIGYGLNAIVSTFPLYLLGSAFWTVGEVVGFPAASALVANLSPIEQRGRYQGAISMAWGLSGTLSPILGGEIMQRLGAPTLWGLCLALAIAVAIGHLLAAPARRRRLAAMTPAGA